MAPAPNTELKELGLRALTYFAIALPGLLAGGALLASFLFGAEAVAQDQHLGPFAALVRPCPGCSLCGMSRGFAALSHGEFFTALDFNPGVILAWPMAWLLLAVSLFGFAKTWTSPPRFFPPPKGPTS